MSLILDLYGARRLRLSSFDIADASHCILEYYCEFRIFFAILFNGVKGGFVDYEACPSQAPGGGLHKAYVMGL